MCPKLVCNEPDLRVHVDSGSAWHADLVRSRPLDQKLRDLSQIFNLKLNDQLMIVPEHHSRGPRTVSHFLGSGGFSTRNQSRT